MREKIYITKEEADYIEKLLSTEPSSESECFGEDEYICHSVTFPDGVEMDVKVCGVQFIEGESNRPFAEAVAYKDGYGVDYSEMEDTYLGEWYCYLNDNEYVVEVLIKEE